MQEQRQLRDSGSAAPRTRRPSTRLLEDVLVEVVDVYDDGGNSSCSERRISSKQQDEKAEIRRRRVKCERSQAIKQLKQEFTSPSKEIGALDDMVELRSPEAERIQLRATWASHYYPKSSTPATSTFRAVIQQDSELRSNQALTLAMDAVCLTEIGTSTTNSLYVQSGAQQYQCAIVLFRKRLQQAVQEQYFNTNLLATSHALMFCERFAGLGTGDEGSYMHMQGLANMMASRGLDSLTSEFEKLLLEDYQHYALRLGMIYRHPVHSRLEKAWAKRVRSSKGPRFFPQICSVAFRLPGLLEESDNACAEIAANETKGRADACVKAMKLISEFSKLETTLQSSLQDWNSSMADLPYSAVPAHSSPFLRESLSSELLDVFPSILAFPSFASAVAHSRLWGCLLLIRSSVSDLFLAVMPEQAPVASRSHNVTECADDLCLSLAYLCNTKDNGLAGPAAVTGHLRLAYKWYEKIEDLPKMAWCRAIADLVKSSGLSAPVFGT